MQVGPVSEEEFKAAADSVSKSKNLTDDQVCAFGLLLWFIHNHMF
jgi:hypothetical protein